MDAPQLTFVAQHRTVIAGLVVLFATCELTFYQLSPRRAPDIHEVASNLGMGVISALLRLATFGVRVAGFAWAASFSPLRIPSTWLGVLACYLGVDFCLYWLHRLLHETELGWALHSTHHSSAQFELSLGARTNWLQNLVDDAFYLPLALVGFDPLLVASMLELNRLAQYWPHTEMIGRLTWLDGWLNTPSNHRVHHALQAGGARGNYGSNFVIWDRMFGTYRREGGRTAYGVEGLAPGANPLRIQFEGIRRYLARLQSGHALRNAYTAWFCVWAVAYARYFGPQFLLWFCCLANVYLLFGVWTRQRLWFSLAAVSVLPVQLLFGLDLGARLLLGVHVVGGTEYLFDPHIPLAIRVLSLFHVIAPALVLHGLARHGYDARAFRLQTALAIAILIACYLGFDPKTQTNDASMPQVAGVAFDRDFNINWVHGLHDAPAPAGRELWTLWTLLAGYPLCVHWPVHWWFTRGRVRLRRRALVLSGGHGE